MDNNLRNAEIVRRYLAGESLSEIGQLQSPSLKRQRIKQIVDEAGVYRPHPTHKTKNPPGTKSKMTSQDIDQAISLYEGGLSWTKVAKLYTKCTRGTLYRLCTNKRPDLRKHPPEMETT